MREDGGDLDRTLEYRAAASIARLLPTGFLLILMGLLGLVFADANDKPESWGNRLFIVVALVTGLGVVAWSLWTVRAPGKPVFTLSPAGIDHRWVSQVLIPWSEVQAIDSIDISTKLLSPLWLFTSDPSPLYRYQFFSNVTVILVSRQFYESRLFVDSVFLRGPGWQGNFIPNGETVQVALHHELVAVDRDELRRAVETRWLAFRDRPATARAGKTVPAFPLRGAAAEGVAKGDEPGTLSHWQRAQIAVLLVGVAACLTNLAGLWQLDGQPEARVARAKLIADRHEREMSQKRMKEESQQREAELRKLRQENEDVLRRAFGR